MFANLAHRKATNGVLAHLVERNTGSVEVSGFCSSRASPNVNIYVCFSPFENALVTNAPSPFIAIKVEKENDIEK